MSENNKEQKSKEETKANPYEESSVLNLLEENSTGASSAAASVTSKDNKTAELKATDETLPTEKTTPPVLKSQDSSDGGSTSKDKEASEAFPTSSLQRSSRVVSHPGAFPISGGTSLVEPAEIPSPYPDVIQERSGRGELLVSAELVQPTDTADVEAAELGTVFVEAKPMTEKDEEQLHLEDLWKNRTVRIIFVVLLLLIVGLIIGLVVGLQKSNRPIEIDDNDTIGDDD
jgi:hypothetical protein